jgi:predicted peptidase
MPAKPTIHLAKVMTMNRVLLCLVLTGALLTSSGMGTWAQTSEFDGLSYRLHPPLDADAAKRYPLVVSLHGAGGGWNKVLVRNKFQLKHPCFVLVPKTKGTWISPETEAPDLSADEISKYSLPLQKLVQRAIARIQGDKSKDLLKVFRLVEKIQKDHPVDPNRVYVVGHSMGGMGSWNAVWERPDLFAAAVPSSGVLPPWKDPSRLVPVPIWAFHGSNDRTVSVEGTRYLFEALKKLAGAMKYTELTGQGHGSNKIAFAFTGDLEDRGFVTQLSSEACDETPDVWDWLFGQSLADRP